MIKIAVFGFYGPDHTRLHAAEHLSPVNTQDFVRAVWALEPPESRIGDVPCFAKLTHMTTQPVYVQCLSDEMAEGAGLLACDGYIAIIDAVKILAPNTIQTALRRLSELQPHAHVIIAAGRQNEPDALAADAIRAILHLHSELLIMPYDPDQPATIERIIRRMVRSIDNPDRAPSRLLAGDAPRLAADRPAASLKETEKARPPAPRIHGLDHAAIIVSDLDRSLRFYQKVLGFRLLGHVDLGGERERTLTHLDTGRGILELISFASDPARAAGAYNDQQTGIPHVALRVTSLDTLAQSLREAGVTFTREPVTAPHGIRLAFITDPDGTLIELVEGEIVYKRR